MSEPNKNKQPVGRDCNEQQSAGLEQHNSTRRVVVSSLDVGLPWSYTRNVPSQFEGQLPLPYYSSIGSNTSNILNNPLLAEQIEGRHGLESMLCPNLSALQQCTRPASESVASLNERRNASKSTKRPTQRADPGTITMPIEHSSPCTALPCARTAASASQAETSVEDSSQLSHATSELVKPKRPLSAYNFFFQEERAKIIEEREHGGGKDSPTTSPTHKKQRYQRNGTGFEDLAKEISKRWKSIGKERLDECTGLADADTARYQRELADYNGLREAKLAALHQAQMASVSEEVWKRYLAEAESQKPPRKRNRKKK